MKYVSYGLRLLFGQPHDLPDLPPGYVYETSPRSFVLARCGDRRFYVGNQPEALVLHEAKPRLEGGLQLAGKPGLIFPKEGGQDARATAL